MLKRSFSYYAFSLMEILVSMAIVSVLMVLLFSMLDQSSRAWGNAERQNDAFREARAALFYISRDLSRLLPTKTGNFCLIDADKKSPTPEMVRITADRPPVAPGQSIFGYITQSDDGQPAGAPGSDVCLAGYYLAFSRDGLGSRYSSYKLYRYFKGSDETFNQFKKIYIDGDTTDPLVLAAVLAGGTADEVLASCIVDFKVVPLEKDASGNLKEAKPEDWPLDKMPAALDVSFSAIGRDAGRTLPDKNAWDTDPLKIVERNARAFSQRIALPNELPPDVSP